MPKIQQTIKKFHELKKRGFKDMWVNEFALNDIGYELMWGKHISEAVEVF